MQQKLPSVQAIQTAISIKVSVRKESAAATTDISLIMTIVTHFVGKVSCCPIFTLSEVIVKAVS